MSVMGQCDITVSEFSSIYYQIWERCIRFGSRLSPSENIMLVFKFDTVMPMITMCHTELHLHVSFYQTNLNLFMATGVSRQYVRHITHIL